VIQPVGYAGASCKAEKVALEIPSDIINNDPEPYMHKHIFIGSDSQSSLMALSASPLRDYRHSCTGYDWSETYQSYVNAANITDSHLYFQWIPAHVGITPNEETDTVVHDHADFFPHDVQVAQPIELKALKSTLKQTIKQKWVHEMPLVGARYHTCGLQQSHLARWRSVP
jgi:hypothetical protein